MNYNDIEKVNSEIQMTNLKGKDYAMVAERITAFRKLYPQGFIKTEMVYHDGASVVMKCATGYREDGNEVMLSTGYAQEVKGRGLVNGTSYIENCVPLDTEILTKDGWKYFYQISPENRNDEVLSLNMQTKAVEFCKLTDIHVYPKRTVYELKTSRFCARCTEEHKWIVRSQYKDISKVKTSDLRKSDKIVQNVTQDYAPSKDGRRLGWLMCDCEITRTNNGMPSTAYINQCKHIEDIKSLFGEGRSVPRLNEEWMCAYQWVVPADEVRRILGKFGISDYSDLGKAMLNADINDVAGCYESMMLADGESRGFSSTYFDLVEAVQIMCVRLGIATGHIKSRMMKGSTKPIHTLSIKKTDGAWFSEINVTQLPPQDVWCPTTENGTWFMRQGDFVTLTSNCETSAVGRALGFAGIGLNGGNVASAEEVANALDAQAQLKEDEKNEIRKLNAKAKEKEINGVQVADTLPI